MRDSDDDLFKNRDGEFTAAELEFLQLVQNEKIYIYLTNGVKITCTLLSYDSICLITTAKESKSRKQLIYKASIATIQEAS